MRLSNIYRYAVFVIASAILSSFSGCSNYSSQINKILGWRNSDGNFSDEQFEQVFELIENDPKTFEYDFSDASHIRIVTSDDHNVRAYILERYGFGGNPSWGFDTRMLIQYKYNGHIYTVRFPETYSAISDIAFLSHNKYVIITFWGSVAQGEHNNSKATVYKIDDEGLDLCHYSFEVDGRFVDEIEVYWEAGVESGDDMQSEVCTDESIRGKGIVYNAFKRDLYIADTKVTFNSNIILSGTYNQYSWNGLFFDDVTLKEPFEAKNRDYYIRIEQNQDGSCSYRCWNGGRKTGKPDLVIHEGLRLVWNEVGLYDYNQWISIDESVPLGDRFTFMNKGYRYLYSTGWHRGRTLECLEVYSPQDELIYSGDFERIDIN